MEAELIIEKHGLKLLHTTWSNIQSLCEVVGNKIKKGGYNPDVIVAISRGGFPPARVLSDLLGVVGLASMRIEYYTSVEKRGKKAVIVYPLNIKVSGKRVLLVDDVADTGHSLVAAKKHVLERGAADVKIATLHYKPKSVIRPDFYAQTTDAWIVYVWEMRETIKQLASELEKKGVRNVRRELVRLGFRDRYVSEVLG